MTPWTLILVGCNIFLLPHLMYSAVDEVSCHKDGLTPREQGVKLIYVHRPHNGRCTNNSYFMNITNPTFSSGKKTFQGGGVTHSFFARNKKRIKMLKQIKMTISQHFHTKTSLQNLYSLFFR